MYITTAIYKTLCSVFINYFITPNFGGGGMLIQSISLIKTFVDKIILVEILLDQHDILLLCMKPKTGKYRI